MDFIAKYWIEAAFGAIVAILTWLCKKLADRVKYEKQKYEALEKGLMALLRERIVQSYHWHMGHGWIETDDLAAFLDLCDQHHNLGGNGTAARLRADVEKLPVKDAVKYMEEHG